MWGDISYYVPHRKKWGTCPLRPPASCAPAPADVEGPVKAASHTCGFLAGTFGIGVSNLLRWQAFVVSVTGVAVSDHPVRSGRRHSGCWSFLHGTLQMFFPVVTTGCLRSCSEKIFTSRSAAGLLSQGYVLSCSGHVFSYWLLRRNVPLMLTSSCLLKQFYSTKFSRSVNRTKLTPFL